MDSAAAAIQLVERAERRDVDDRFKIMDSIKEAARELFDEFQLPLEVALEAADQAYDRLIGPIDLPGPDMVLDPIFKMALRAGIKQAYQLLDL